jgi:hypothetical protein
VHFHLGDYNSHMRRLIYEIDLTKYLAAGYEITQEPTCYFQERDLGHSGLCQQIRKPANRQAASRAWGGIYRWEFEEIEEGVVDISWDLALPAERKDR